MARYPSNNVNDVSIPEPKKIKQSEGIHEVVEHGDVNQYADGVKKTILIKDLPNIEDVDTSTITERVLTKSGWVLPNGGA